jgi:hypothetical protein
MTRPKRMNVYLCLFFFAFFASPDQLVPPHVRDFVSVQPIMNVINGSWIIVDLDIGIAKELSALQN